MDDLINQIVNILGSNQSNDPTVNELVKLLSGSGVSAKVDDSLLYSENGITGQYDHSNKEVRISPAAQTPSTVGHELTHALDSVMGSREYQITADRWKGKSTTDGEKQFANGYRKLNDKTKLPISGASDYRQSRNELKAFGVGNQLDRGNGGYNKTSSPHLDPTMATEEAIMRELYSRILPK